MKSLTSEKDMIQLIIFDTKQTGNDYYFRSLMYSYPLASYPETHYYYPDFSSSRKNTFVPHQTDLIFLKRR